MEVMTLAEAAYVCHCSVTTIRKLLVSGKLRGRKVGRCWVMTASALEDYIDNGQNDNDAHRCHRTDQGENTWHCTNAETFGGLVSQHQTERRLDALLKLKTKSMRNSSLTN